jgi:hypothetical protein
MAWGGITGGLSALGGGSARAGVTAGALQSTVSSAAFGSSSPGAKRKASRKTAKCSMEEMPSEDR